MQRTNRNRDIQVGMEGKWMKMAVSRSHFPVITFSDSNLNIIMERQFKQILNKGKVDFPREGSHCSTKKTTCIAHI
jgi:hypothetical protein